MAVVNSIVNHVKVSNNLEHIEAKLFYPKILIIQNKNAVHLLQIDGKKEDKSSTCEIQYKFNVDIIDKAEQNHLLWLVLQNGEIIIINTITNLKIHITVDNYKIRKLFCDDSKKLVFISESGEHSLCSLSLEDIDTNFAEGITELTISFLKTPVQSCAVLKTSKSINVWKGLNAFMINEESIVLKCPLTDLNENVSINKSLHDFLPWEDMIVLAERCSMWIINLKDANIFYQFPSVDMNYNLIEVYNNTLYYITWQETEINICCAWNSTSTSTEKPGIYKYNSNNELAELSSQETLKIQLKTLIDMALLETKPAQVTTQMQSLFTKIEDFIFLINSASKLCQHSLGYKSILYSLQHRINLANDNDAMYILADLINKVDLLEYICFKGNNNYENVNLYDKNFIELCVTFISKSDLDFASICWLKYTEIKLPVNSDDVTNILNAVPYNIKMSALIIWLKSFGPPLLDENPFFIDHFVKWTMDRVFKLEQSVYWPKIGLKFIEEIIAVLEHSLKMVTVHPISMDDLDTLKEQIIYVMELKEKYRINILLSELSSQSPNEVALIMLRRCYTEDLEMFLQEYLPSYASRHLFELDNTLRTYVESEAAISGGGVDGCRLKLLLNSFRSTTSKLDCLLQVLKVLDVPWNDVVLHLAVTAAASAARDFTVTETDRALALEIQKELNYAKIKVVLKKYNFPLTCTDYMLVLNKIMCAASVDLSDLNTISNVMTHLKSYSSILYIDRCLNDCETKTALKYFKDLDKKDKNVVLKATLNKYEQIINSDANNLSLERNYLDFLKGTSLLSTHQTSDIKSLYHLKNSYDITMTVNNFYDEYLCQEQASDWISKNGGRASSAQGENVTKLTRTYQSHNSCLINMLRQTPATSSVRELLESLLQFQSEGILTHLDSSPLSCFKDGCNTSLLIDSFNTLTDLVSKCEEDYLHVLVQYLSLLNAIINSNVMLKHLSVAWKFQYIYLPMSSVTGLNDLITFFEMILSSKHSSTDDGHNIVEGYDFIPIKMVFHILNQSLVSGTLLSEDFYVKRDKVIRKLLSKVISCQELDELLLACLLLILSRNEEKNNRSWLFDALRGQNETIPQVLMCFISSPLLRQTFILDENFSGSTVPYPPQYVLKSKFNINLADIALPDNTEETWDVKVILFCVLKQHPNTDFDRLVELCRTLNVTINDGLTLQIVSLLSSWNLKYKLFNDELNCRQINFENDEKKLLSKCYTIWENIERKDLLGDILNDFWKNGEVSLHGRSVTINPYYYEVYLCIYHLLFGSAMEMRNKKEYLLLNYLKDYRRKGSPKQFEFELYSVKGMFPEIGYYRLPFNLFKREDMWSNLKSEITLETYERWLPVVGLLSLDADLQTAKDMICSNALKQTMTSRKREGSTNEGKENEPWRLTTREEPLLRAAHKCVRHIANMEWAGACLFYVLQGCARGADQVAAAQLCYQFAQRWAAVQPGNRAVRQMEKLHCSLSTRHALHKIEWACEEFVGLSTEPARLIRALYLHPSFVEKMSRHDVNRAANDIADKNGINISSIRIQILENILDKSYQENTRVKKISGLNIRELKTAKYILKATCPKMGAIYLSRIAFDDESDHNKCKKLSALQCLMSVVETDTAVKVTNREREALWNSLVELIHIVNLENIDMPWVVATFMQDKCRAIEQLLQVGTNTGGLQIAAELGRRYGNVNIIRDLISFLLRAGLYEEMIPLLLKVSAPPYELIYAAWRSVLVTPFQQADYPITERQKAKCIRAINLLPVCPDIKDEDLIEIWKNCVRCKCLGVGCLVLPYMTAQARQSLSELQKVDKRNLIASLKNLHAETYLISGAMHVVENLSSRGQR